MIPKRIHYCWFGGNPKSVVAEQCLRSWKKYCPDYEIVEWNELNYDIAAAPVYVQQAYTAKKWAFVTDFVRLQVVYENGGIYLDTDVELVKQPDRLLRNKAYFGFEGTEFINTGLGFGAEKGNPVIYEIMQDYMEITFLLENGEYDVTPCPQRNTSVFLRHGLEQNGAKQFLDDDTLILSSEYLCPLDNATRILRKTSNTVSIHHFDASWQSAVQREKHDAIARRRRSNLRKEKIIYFPRWLLRKIIGDERYEKIKHKLKD